MASEAELVALQETLYTSGNPTRRWLHCSRRDWIGNALRSTPSHLRGRALEVGPGSGVYLSLLAGLFAEVVASDIEAAYLKHAEHLCHAHPNLRLVADDVTASAMPAQSFDLILCSEVIEHIADSQAALAGMRRLLKPGGMLILSTPQRYSLLEQTAKIAFLPGMIQLVRKIYREPILETGHINLMTAREVERQLSRAGLRVVERNKSGMYIPLLAEFGGDWGLQTERWLEQRWKGSRADALLWTQYYVAHAPTA
jgi:ubiquinone/menaquinone biosynthesis C-methylase UbiE